jgi:hypothetical protein
MKRSAAVLAIAHEFLFRDAGVDEQFKGRSAEGTFDGVRFFHEERDTVPHLSRFASKALFLILICTTGAR